MSWPCHLDFTTTSSIASPGYKPWHSCSLTLVGMSENDWRRWRREGLAHLDHRSTGPQDHWTILDHRTTGLQVHWACCCWSGESGRWTDSNWPLTTLHQARAMPCRPDQKISSEWRCDWPQLSAEYCPRPATTFVSSQFCKCWTIASNQTEHAIWIPLIDPWTLTSRLSDQIRETCTNAILHLIWDEWNFFNCIFKNQ